jgi:tol-pal system protein YbgF
MTERCLRNAATFSPKTGRIIEAMKHRANTNSRVQTASQKWLAVCYCLRVAVLVFGIGFPVASFLITPVVAQESKVLRELQRLSKDLRDLQQYIYKDLNKSTAVTQSGTSLSADAAQVPDSDVASRMLIQVQRVDGQLRQLTGKLEELEYSIGAMASRLDRLVGDVDLRLQSLETSMQVGLIPQQPVVSQGAQPTVFATPPPQPVLQVPIQQQIQASIGSSNGTAGAKQFGSAQETTIISSAGATAGGTIGQGLAPVQQAVPAGQVSGLLPGQRPLGTVTGSQLASGQSASSVQPSSTTQRQSSLVPKAGQVRPLSLAQESELTPARASTPAPTVVAKQQVASPSILPAGTPKQKYDHAFSLLQKRDFDSAEQALRAFLQQHPEDEHAGNAYYWLGETYYVRKQYTDAAIIFSDGYSRFPEGTKAPDNLLKLGKSLAEVGEKVAACKTFTELLGQFPNANTRILANAKGELDRVGCN